MDLDSGRYHGRIAAVKCLNCGGVLTDSSAVCSYCGAKQDRDLLQVNYRNLGTARDMPCPSCDTPMSVIRIETEPGLTIERCTGCFGLFFNPGEFEAFLTARTPSLVWLDNIGLKRIAADFYREQEVRYVKCPMCADHMSRVNFGGRSGVIVDQCGSHGVWVDGGKVRHLTEWWRAGGKILYEQHEAGRAKPLSTLPPNHKTTLSNIYGDDASPLLQISESLSLAPVLIDGLLSCLGSLVD